MLSSFNHSLLEDSGRPWAIHLRHIKVLVVTFWVLSLIPIVLLFKLSNPAAAEAISYFGIGTIVLTSFAFLHQPFVTLSLTLVYLVSPLAFDLDRNESAVLTTLLMGMCAAGCVLVLGYRTRFQWRHFRIPLLLCSVALFGAAQGVRTGNQLSLTLGDLYQLLEFSTMFLLGKLLVKTDQQFRTLVHVIIGAVITTSAYQMLCALMGSDYLPHLNQEGIDVVRTINLNAPIAVVILLAALGSQKRTGWILTGVSVLLINLIWSFTRGLWLASAASVMFLLIVQRGRSRRTILVFCVVACTIGAPILYLSGLGSIMGNRITYSVEQFDTASEDDQVLSGRRVLEYILILPKIVEHPFAGNGLGATFAIAGDAVLEGPRGEQVDHHFIHNLYLLVAFRLGIPALLLFLVMLWKYFQHSLKGLREWSPSPESSPLITGLIAAVFGEVILSMTSPTFLNHPTAGLLGCIMAITTIPLRSNLSPPAPA